MGGDDDGFFVHGAVREVLIAVGLHLEEVSVAGDELVFFFVGIQVDEGDAGLEPVVAVEVREMEHVSRLHGESHGEVGGANEDEVDVVRVVGDDALAEDGGVFVLPPGVVAVAVAALDEDLLRPAVKEVVGHEFDVEATYLVKDFRRFKGGVGVQVLEHTHDAAWTLFHSGLTEVAADAVYTFHVYGIVGGLRVAPYDVDLLGFLQADVMVGFR